MDLVKLFTREENIAGLEIDDDYIRIALCARPQNKEVRPRIVSFAQKKLSEGIVVEGEIKKPKEFLKTIQELFNTFRPRTRFIIISLPVAKAYTRVHTFPKGVVNTKIEEAMKLTIGFQLPTRIEDVYLDWEKIQRIGTNDVFLSTFPRSVIDTYITLLSEINVKVVAVELHPLSIARAIKIENEKTVLIIEGNSNGITLSFFDGVVVRFSRYLQISRFLKKEEVETEISKAIDFYEAEYRGVVSGFILFGGNTHLEDIKLSIPSLEVSFDMFDIEKEKKSLVEAKWAIALGAAFRGTLPRATDEQISLLSIGTEEAYEKQKAVVFSQFVSNVLLGVGLVITVAFVTTWFFLISLQRDFETKLNVLNSISLPSDAQALEARVIKTNELIGRAKNIAPTIPSWIPLIQEIRARMISGIIIQSFSTSHPQSVVLLSGMAQNRSQLNLFKKSLEASPFFFNINLPITNIGQKENISFSISFDLKDKTILFPDTTNESL